MKSIFRAFARHNVFANILLVMILFMGVAASQLLIRETFPKFSLDTVQVRVPYPGGDPEEVEEGICIKIEEAIEGIEGIKKYDTFAAENMGTALIEVREDYGVDEVKEDIKNAVDAINTFPSDAEKPITTELTFSQEVMVLAVSGPMGERRLKEWAESIKDELLELPEVSQVELSGVREYEISIEVSEERLREYGLTFGQVARAIHNNNLNMPGGTIRSEGEEIRLRTLGRKYTGEEFASIVAVANPEGEMIPLERIAEIDDGFVEDGLSSELNGEPAVLVRVLKTEEEDALAIASAVEDYVAGKQDTVPPGLSVSVWSDQTELINDRLNLLIKNGVIGLILVFFVLWLFLNLRLSFWASIGIPISLSGALFLMWLIGASLNMISLFGLIMVLGIIVDDAVVVGEAIYVHRKNGDSPLDAAVNGVSEVGLPVLAAVSTTIVAFVPLLFVEGIMGKFIAIMPVVVITALLVSLVEVLIMLPAHLNHLPDPNAPLSARVRFAQRVERFQSRFSEGLEAFIERVYAPFLEFILKYRYVALASAACLLLITIGLIRGGFIKYEMFPEMDGNQITATVEFPNGTPLDVTEEAVDRLKAAIQRLGERTGTVSGEPLVESVYALTGGSLGDGNPGGFQGSGSPSTGSVRVELLDTEMRGVSTEKLKIDWEEEAGALPGVIALTFSTGEMGPPGAAIEVWLQGKDLDTILAAAEDLQNKLRTYAGVYQIRSDFRPGKKELRFRLKDEARTLGLTVEDLATQIYAGYFGQEAVRIQRGDEDIRVRVRYSDHHRSQMASLDAIRIRTPDGREVPLVSVADVTTAPGYSTITRTNGQRRVAVSAEAAAGANAQEILAALQRGGAAGSDQGRSFFDELRAEYPQVRLSVQGEQEDSRESLSSLMVSFPLALMGIFVIIATIFRSYLQPLVIMFTVPFGIIGAVYGHLALGYSLTMLSLFGVVALTGIVVNGAIVLIERVNGNVAQGYPFFEALKNAGARRFRAIFLTSISTCGGLAPIILERDLQAQFVIPMALSIASGVLFAMLLTLGMIPCMLGVLNDLRRLFVYLKTGAWPVPEEVEPARWRHEDQPQPAPPGLPADSPAGK